MASHSRITMAKMTPEFTFKCERDEFPQNECKSIQEIGKISFGPPKLLVSKMSTHLQAYRNPTM
jgi:hypothetical protein